MRALPRLLAACALAAAALPRLAAAGPPYATDDPEPVGYGHFEIYLASQSTFTAHDGAGTLPHVEVNGGALPELQLHVIAPLAFADRAGAFAWGPGDVELGAKWRFLGESARLPQVGTFPLLEVPAGSAARGLGAGAFQVFLPVWIQKSFGPWTTYGGGGAWLTLGGGHARWWFAGWMLQRQLTPHLALGAEVFYESARPDAAADVRADAGAVLDLTEHHHILLSAGRALAGAVVLQGYVAYQLTF